MPSLWITWAHIDSFFEWREPTRTRITLGLLAVCWLAVTLIPLHAIIKITQFNAGVIFFGLFPIATRYPQYRLLASPLKWLLWRIPTDGKTTPLWPLAPFLVCAPSPRNKTLIRVQPNGQ